jgi:4-amino-4-deoxy-L-arabinose transferase-like glycosyltransferase
MPDEKEEIERRMDQLAREYTRTQSMQESSPTSALLPVESPDMKPSDLSTTSRGLVFQFGNWLYLPLLAFAFVVYSANLRSNPPGFFVDESSIALNAYTISQSGTDEHGNKWPVYFRAFGEYKNPTYIYLLAAVFKLTGPGIFTARMVSASLGFAAALLMGLLAFRISSSRFIGVFVGLTALLTPWLFEISRLVFEVALYPLTLAFFLLVVHRAYTKGVWELLDSAFIGVALGFLTYTYTVGRLLAPLLAIGLTLFVNAGRWRGVICAWIVYIVTLIPLFPFKSQYPGAITERFYALTYVGQGNSLSETVWQFFSHPGAVWQFFSHYLRNLNLWTMLVTGDPNPRHHITGMGCIFVATVILAIVGLVLVLYRHRRDAWWQFILYGLVVSVIPASLTRYNLHALRLVAFPVFLLLLLIPALAWLETHNGNLLLRRKVLISAIALTLLQAGIFQLQFHTTGPTRIGAFDVDFTTVFDFVVSSPNRPIYSTDLSYAHAYWYGILRGMDLSEFKSTRRPRRPPSGGLVICRNCKEGLTNVERILVKEGPFIAYIVPDK